MKTIFDRKCRNQFCSWIFITGVGSSSLALTGCQSVNRAELSSNTEPATAAQSMVVRPEGIMWGALNPLRGAASPRAGTVWGDRSGTGATGFMVEFVDGFSSPPHIHNVTYRGVVLEGSVHNADPAAEMMWMPAGSYWTQPAGDIHITAANGARNLAYIEIESGPYLVRPTDEAFAAGEIPLNVAASNIVWVDSSVGSTGTHAHQMAYLWGSPSAGGVSGTMLKLPAGFRGVIENDGAAVRAVVINGAVHHHAPGKPDRTTLEQGGSFWANEGLNPHLECGSDAGCLLYIRSEGTYSVGPMR